MKKRLLTEVNGFEKNILLPKGKKMVLPFSGPEFGFRYHLRPVSSCPEKYDYMNFVRANQNLLLHTSVEMDQ